MQSGASSASNSGANGDSDAEDVVIVRWEVDPPTLRFTDVDATAVDLLGFPTERWYEAGFWESAIFEADRKRVVDYCIAETRRGRSHAVEYRMVGAQGQIVWVHDAITVEMDGANVARVHGILLDISRRMETQARLERRETLLDALAMSVPSGLYVVEGDTGHVSYANDRFFEIWNAESLAERIRRGEAGNRELIEHCAELVADPATFAERCKPLSNPKNRETTEYEVQMADGRAIACYSSPIRGGCGDVRRLHVFHDITADRQARRDLQEWKDRYEAACEVSGHIVYDWSPRDGVVKFGGTMQDVLGRSNEELEGDASIWGELVHPEDREQFYEVMSSVARGAASCQLEYRIQHKDGGYRSVEGRGRTVFDEDGSVVRSVGFVADLTERKRAEEERRQLELERRQAEKLESLGILAGGIAHDFNNILTAIAGNTSLVADSLPAGSALRTQLEKVLQSAGRAKDLVRHILTYSRQTRSEMHVVDPVPIVQEAVETVRPSLAGNIELVTKFDSGEARIQADETEIHSVVMNLLTNAGQALEADGGRIIVRLQRTMAEVTQGASSGHILLSVRDDGPGMPAEIRERIFEPFFTTKPAGTGAGLGMAVTHGIVVEHGGLLEVDSEPGVGTEFRVYLPVAEGPLETEAEGPTASTMAKRSLRILVVDDQMNVLDVIVGMLEQLGHSVVATGEPNRALDWFRQSSEGFDVVITDLSMPSAGGVELASEIQRIGPCTPVVLITGFDPKLPADVLEAAGIRSVLNKPFLAADLERGLGEALASDSPEAPPD